MFACTSENADEHDILELSHQGIRFVRDLAYEAARSGLPAAQAEEAESKMFLLWNKLQEFVRRGLGVTK